MIAEPSSFASPSDNPELPPSLEPSIKYRAHRLARAFHLGFHDREDLSQTLALKVIGARARHPEAGRSNAFLRSVLDLAYIDIARSLRRRGDRPGFDPVDPEVIPASSFLPAGGWTHEVDLRMDLDAAIDSLPHDLEGLAVLLRQMSVRDAAERIGCHRGTVYRRTNRIRTAFGIFFDGKDVPRDNRGPSTERSCGTGRTGRPAPGARPMPDPPAPPCPVSASRADRRRP